MTRWMVLLGTSAAAIAAGVPAVATIAASMWLAEVAIPPAAHAPASVTGSILGHDGGAVPGAVAQITDPSTGAERVRVYAGADGGYAISYEGAGLVVVRLSAPNHASVQVPLILEANDRATVDAKLGAYAYADLTGLDALRLIGDMNGWSYELAVPVARDSDGLFRRTVEVEDGRFAYQILDAVPGRSVAGPTADRYEFDGSGDYRAVIETDAPLVDVEIDPAAFPRGPTEPTIEVDAAHEASLRLRGAAREIESRRDLFLWRLEDARRTLDSNALMQPLRDDMALELPSVIARARAAGSPEREALYVSALQTMRLAGDPSFDPAFVTEALALLSPRSPYWALVPELIGYVAAVTEFEKATQLLDALSTLSPDAGIRKMAHMAGYDHALRAGARDPARAHLTSLIDRYPDSREAMRARRLLGDLDTPIRPGRMAPELELSDLDGGEPHRLGAFRGHVVLLDFWATWCKPCIVELPHLRDAHARHASEGFTILSLSLDRSPEVIHTFREKHPMPWRHAFLEAGVRHAVARAYHVTSLPKPVLIGRDGTIVAVGAELRGPALGEKVRAALEAAPR